MKIEAGETLVLYTDGLTEANNANGDFYGEEALQAAIQSCLQSPAEEICAEILRAVAAFEGGAPRADDITLMVLRREI